jgi:hypothetical protein
VSTDRIRLDPEPSPAEAEAVRQALAALGLIEDAGDARPAPPGAADPDP